MVDSLAWSGHLGVDFLQGSLPGHFFGSGRLAKFHLGPAYDWLGRAHGLCLSLIFRHDAD
jgi:hypothetical protein